MTFTRMHIGFLSIVSIFTGIISPVVGNNIISFPFPLTNMQIIAYIILIFLAVICILLTVRSWNWVRFFGVIVILLICYLFITIVTGNVRSLTGIDTPFISWGWVFLFVGSGLLIGCMYSDVDEEEHITITDHMIGWLGAVSILALTGLIVSISYISQIDGSKNKNILSIVFGSGYTEVNSGMILSPAFPSINNLIFDRKNDSLRFYISSGTEIVQLPDNKKYNRLPYAETTIENMRYIVHADGSIINSNGIIIGNAQLPQKIDQSILMKSGSKLQLLTSTGLQEYSGVYTDISDITKEGINIVWKSKTGSGYTLYKNGTILSKEENEISNITMSSDGKSVMYITKEKDGSSYVIKNGAKVEKIGIGYKEGSLKMNGKASIYVVESNGILTLIHNGKLLDRKFDEIREIFIEKDSDGFVYFGRPLGEKTYCLYTRYRGNLCGLSGYMNPTLSADGTSVIFAGLKDGIWGIYRNASPIIRNTGYPNRDNISQDYVFFDKTNPSYYLFIKRIDTGYQLYTKGKWIDQIWKDVGLDVTFGYDNKVIMSVQDNNGWRIIEIN